MADEDQNVVADRKLKMARAEAIHQYATVEQSLCSLFAQLLGTKDELAAIVFFRIIAARSRNKIIEALLKKRFGTQYRNYWNGIPGSPGVEKQPGLMALIKQLDSIRNDIVHWSVAVNVGEGPVTNKLIPPNIWGFADDQRSLSVEDLDAFSGKATFVSRSINSFNTRTFHPMRDQFAGGDTWREIFQQPCVYPPADNHPLVPKT